MTDRQHLVVGSGPTAVIAAAALQAEGRPVVLVSMSELGMLSRTKIVVGTESADIALVPIFAPAVSTDLSNLLTQLNSPLPTGDVPLLEKEYLFDPPSGRAADPDAGLILSDRTIPFATAMASLGERSYILAAKQYGDKATNQPLMLARSKIWRAYFHGRAGDPPRIGYLNGESPYASSTRVLSRSLRRIRARLTGIDPAARVAQLSDGTSVEYSGITYTGVADILGRLLGGGRLAQLRSDSAPAVFCAGFTAATGQTPTSRLRYDLRPQSPVLRLAAPTDGQWAAQLSVDRSSWPAEVGNHLASTNLLWLERHVSELLGTQARASSEVVRYTGAYPLEPIPPDVNEELDARCEEAGIVRFGRYAEWQYVDLHELDWEKLLR